MGTVRRDPKHAAWVSPIRVRFVEADPRRDVPWVSTLRAAAVAGPLALHATAVTVATMMASNVLIWTPISSGTEFDHTTFTWNLADRTRG